MKVTSMDTASIVNLENRGKHYNCLVGILLTIVTPGSEPVFPSFAEAQTALIDAVDCMPLDELRMFTNRWRELLKPNKSYSFDKGDTASASRAILKRTLDTMLEARERDRLSNITIYAKCALLRFVVKRAIEKHGRAVVLARKGDAPSWYFDQLSLYFEAHAFVALVNLDIDIRRFAAYMMQAVVLETVALDIEAYRTDAYIEYDYMMQSEREYSSQYLHECDKTTPHWLRIAVAREITSTFKKMSTSAINVYYLGVELEDV